MNDAWVLELARTTPFSYAALQRAWESYAMHYARITDQPLYRIGAAETQKVWAHFSDLIHASCRFGDATPLDAAMALEARYGIERFR
jgi:hypothetical protein